MKQYWLRIAAAWFLLQFAARVMKSAEDVLRTASEAKGGYVIVDDSTTVEDLLTEVSNRG